jgi:hypothetical protein
VPATCRARRSEDLVTAAAGTWLILALFADGWAHFNVPELEGFFTPWHGALYSGFAATALWVAVLGLRRGVTVPQGLRHPLHALRSLPVGYPLAGLGVIVFAFGAVADLIWHETLGVEVGIDALLSPSHLTLFLGGTLLLTAPLRGAWTAPDGAAGLAGRLPELLSLALTTSLTGFFLLYSSAFLRPGVDEAFLRLPEDAPGHEAAEIPAILTLTSFLVTTALLVVPVLLLAKRGPVPRGAVPLLVVPLVWLSVALDDFEQAPLAIAVTLAAVAVDLTVRRADRLPAALRLPAVGGVVPLMIWPAALLAVALTDAVRYPVALWSGVVVLTVFAGALLGGLARPASADAPGAAPQSLTVFDGSPGVDHGSAGTTRR